MQYSAFKPKTCRVLQRASPPRVIIVNKKQTPSLKPHEMNQTRRRPEKKYAQRKMYQYTNTVQYEYCMKKQTTTHQKTHTIAHDQRVVKHKRTATQHKKHQNKKQTQDQSQPSVLFLKGKTNVLSIVLDQKDNNETMMNVLDRARASGRCPPILLQSAMPPQAENRFESAISKVLDAHGTFVRRQ